MLQNDAVRNLQYDSEIRVAQQDRSEPTGELIISKEYVHMTYVCYSPSEQRLFIKVFVAKWLWAIFRILSY